MCFKCIAIKHKLNNMPLPQPPAPQPQLQLSPQTPLQLTQTTTPPALPAPAVTTVCLKCNACTPVCDDDQHYSVSSYKQKLQPCNAEHASIAQMNRNMKPKMYAKTMARPDVAMWEAACEEEQKSIKAMEVFKVMLQLECKKIVLSSL